MARIICSIEHASTNINGVKFTPDRNQMLSEEISDEQAAFFTSIKGFTLVPPKMSAAQKAAATKAAAAEAQRLAEAAQAEADADAQAAAGDTPPPADGAPPSDATKSAGK